MVSFLKNRYIYKYLCLYGMGKPLTLLVCFVLFEGLCFSQVNETWDKSGFEQSDSTNSHILLTTQQISDKLTRLHNKSGSNTFVGGYMTSIFHETVDSALISVSIQGKKQKIIYPGPGLFLVNINGTIKGKLIDISIHRSDYHEFDTAFVAREEKPVILVLNLIPKYKIYLRGRVYSGNVPLEGVNVEIRHGQKKYTMKTRGCYYDKDDYWNCLYDGMFKAELTANDPDDSIYISLNKKGMKPLVMGMTFGEYKGDVMDLKMKYDRELPEVPVNNINLKLAFPFTSSYKEWYIGLSYYRLLQISHFKRIFLGLDGNITVLPFSEKHETFPGLGTSTSDSSYITLFAGPSFQFWIIKPEIRKFSTYLGCVGALQFDNHQFVPIPFLGTRYFIDMNKALSLELRYLSFNRDVYEYTFNPLGLGNASRFSVSNHYNEFLLNLGIQVVF